MMSRMRTKRKSSRGATLVEAALFFTFIIFLTFAIIQFALIMNGITTVQYYAREAARYSCVHYKDANFGSSTVQTFVSGSLATPGSTIPYSALSGVTYYGPGVTLDNNATPPSSSVTVEVKYDLTKKYLFFPYIPGLPKPWTYTYYYTTFAEGS